MGTQSKKNFISRQWQVSPKSSLQLSLKFAEIIDQLPIMASGEVDFLRRYILALRPLLPVQKSYFAKLSERDQEEQIKDFKNPQLMNFQIIEQIYSIEPSPECSTQDFSAILLDCLAGESPENTWFYIVNHETSIGLNNSKYAVIMFFSRPLNSSEKDFLELWQGLIHNHLRWLERLESAEKKIHKDDLTGLGNARYLDVSLEQELRRSERFGEKFSLLFIDVDNFKMINDTHGHVNGSKILAQIGNLLGETAREVDRVCRYGGDEFVIILVQADIEKANLVAERLREKVATFPFLLQSGATVRLTISIGITTCPDHAKDRDELLSIADQCMYRSKQQGKNSVTVFKPLDELKKIPRNQNPGKEKLFT